MDYNLTQRERQIVIQLVELSRHSREYFIAQTLDPATVDGPARELARLGFGEGGATIDLTKRDLRLLKDEGLIHFRWDRPDRGRGRLSSIAFEAVSSNFGSGNPQASAAKATAAAARAVIADEDHRGAGHPRRKADRCR
jgi:hypothetical protein